MPIKCCLACEQRAVGCHASCPNYKAARAALDAEKAKERDARAGGKHHGELQDREQPANDEEEA